MTNAMIGTRMTTTLTYIIIITKEIDIVIIIGWLGRLSSLASSCGLSTSDNSVPACVTVSQNTDKYKVGEVNDSRMHKYG